MLLSSIFKALMSSSNPRNSFPWDCSLSGFHLQGFGSRIHKLVTPSPWLMKLFLNHQMFASYPWSPLPLIHLSTWRDGDDCSTKTLKNVQICYKLIKDQATLWQKDLNFRKCMSQSKENEETTSFWGLNYLIAVGTAVGEEARVGSGFGGPAWDACATPAVSWEASACVSHVESVCVLGCLVFHRVISPRRMNPNFYCGLLLS